MGITTSVRPVKLMTRGPVNIIAALLVIISLTGGCFLDTEVEPYYGRVVTPRAQEFRWSDGGVPQVFDPALAATPPDTDAVRAMFEGLTEYDPHTLAPVPGVASHWESTPDGKEWTFYLRHDAHWSNGDPVTAMDFVRSWKRVASLGLHAPHARLMQNIEGVSSPPATHAPPQHLEEHSSGPRPNDDKAIRRDKKEEAKLAPVAPAPFGAEAVDDYVLRVHLLRPDMNFPALVAHTVFRPVHSQGQGLMSAPAASGIVSNGAFQLSKAGRDGVTLERHANYWDAQAVNLQRVQFVASRDAEAALASYRAGEVDVVMNAALEPLALKLLTPYKDFRRFTYGALTYYSFNTAHQPFNDVRVREALAIAIDRDHISEDEMGGATEPAQKFLPVQVSRATGVNEGQVPILGRNIERAQGLLAAAGFPQGKGFPRLKLLVNRNDQQRQVAQAVAAMWRSVLKIETDITLRNWDDYEAALRAGAYDVARRGMVLQTTDEATNMRVMFGQEGPTQAPAQPSPDPKTENSNKTPVGGTKTPKQELSPQQAGETLSSLPEILSERQALEELPAMPIYFASSYALVKPYVTGFETNLLDAPSLKHVRIQTSWQPSTSPTQIQLK